VLIPVPGDLIIGVYYPWLNSNWGYPIGVAVKNTLTSDVISQFWLGIAVPVPILTGFGGDVCTLINLEVWLMLSAVR
jgi:hypothetical protein